MSGEESGHVRPYAVAHERRMALRAASRRTLHVVPRGLTLAVRAS
ncbi:hypothetical protein [Streptomyces sp. NPDC046939]